MKRNTSKEKKKENKKHPYKKRREPIKRSTLFAIFGIFLVMTMSFFHEQTHVAIFSYYGVESHVEYFSNFPHLVTIADEPCNDEACGLAHNINEIVSYNFMMVFILIFIGFLFLISMLEKRE